MTAFVILASLLLPPPPHRHTHLFQLVGDPFFDFRCLRLHLLSVLQAKLSLQVKKEEKKASEITRILISLTRTHTHTHTHTQTNIPIHTQTHTDTHGHTRTHTHTHTRDSLLVHMTRCFLLCNDVLIILKLSVLR